MFKHAKRMICVAAMALIVPLASLGEASSAMAAPGGVFSVFADCPLVAFRALGVPPGRSLCGYHQMMSGELVLGSMDVPIDRTITLQGGFIPTTPTTEVEFFGYPPENGEIMSKTEQNVPGGLSGLLDCEEIKGNGYRERFERYACRALSFYGGTSGVTATLENVATVENPTIYNEHATAVRMGTSVRLPIRVHLKNPLLGNSCYIGSESNPIELELTTGTTSPLPPNKPIEGEIGSNETLEENGLLMLRTPDNSLADNTFSVPAAEGCGESFSSIIDPLLDSKLKLPSPDGYNTAILTGTAYIASVEEVEANERIQEEAEAKKKQEEAEAKRNRKKPKPKRNRKKPKPKRSRKKPKGGIGDTGPTGGIGRRRATTISVNESLSAQTHTEASPSEGPGAIPGPRCSGNRSPKTG